MNQRLLSAGLSIIAVSALGAPAAAQNQLWLLQFGTSGNEVIYALCPDSAGGAFATGTGPLGNWLARYDSAGNQTWPVVIGNNSDELSLALCPDSAGGAFVAGWTTGSLGGPPAGGVDAWLARYDSAGNQIWIRQFGTSAHESAWALCPDGAGGAFVAGRTNGSLGGLNAGAYDAWLARYDSAGNQMWIRQFGTSINDFAYALCSDGVGGAFITGESFLARYDSAGNQTWIRNSAVVFALCPDGAGGSFAAGGEFDAWLARYDSAGAQTWIRPLGSSGEDHARALCPDGAGGAFVAGRTSGSLAGSNAGYWDAWLAWYDSAGTQTWILQLGSSGEDYARALCADGEGGAFIGGSVWAGSLGGPSAGGMDAWLARYGPCYADCNGDGSLTVADFGCFQTRFVAADPYADCNGDASNTVADFACFQTKFVQGCP